MRFGVSDQRFDMARVGRVGVVLLAVGMAAGLAGCKTNVAGGLNETYHSGFVPPPNALEQIPVGASQDQVRIVLGTPSTTAEFGGDVWYYISQTRVRRVAFQNQKIVDQRVLAIYFDKDRNIERVADYGLKDGKVFEFITQTTPTGGKDQAFLEQVLTGALGVGANNPFGG
ncbi:outer membrane protein assembly factor BamE [Mesorhizobium sp. BR1-1-16]|uniref:outer membrane protein assembly factor BamE n=1 Tax=Mesorhizobium sp. BR1-1-16 TaxID=2876653 RepID=UPI001CCF7C70|nr:outer membrane protein assembly factor BamE [Mesorhizobium sp. BR1-1-16]MBZ9938223.1 outer membrane protein assembly factor BamE [Mesorhizobium sp. BR1-1-16]